MRNPDEFDAFYFSARSPLLAQTFALTGDLGASRNAVRDTFVYAWHHWRKISALEDPMDAVRPHAWRAAQRRHTARILHRERGLTDSVHDTLKAVSKLDTTQRRAVLLAHLAEVPLTVLAHEIARPKTEAEQLVSLGTQALADSLGIAAQQVPARLAELEAPVADVRLPRPSIIRRAGAARRRTQTVVGVAAAASALLISGSVVTNATGVRPSLDRESSEGSAPSAGSPDSPEIVVPETLDRDDLLGPAELAGLVGRKGWSVVRTGDNSEDNGLVLPCQRDRYADPEGTAAVLREYAIAKPRNGKPPARAFTFVEESANPRAARRAFSDTVDWFGQCDVPRAQLLGTRRIARIGDDARLITLRTWEGDPSTISAAVARSGSYTVTALTVVENTRPANVVASAALLSGALEGLCGLDAVGPCLETTPPSLEDAQSVAPVPVGEMPAMLAVLDLPRIQGIDRPWAATEPVRAKNNLASTRCDETDFAGTFKNASFRFNKTRQYLIPQAKRLPATFGLTQTVALLPEQQAKGLLGRVRQRMNACSDSDLGTEVRLRAQRKDGARVLEAWDLTTRVSENQSLDYSMAMLRNGGAVSQLTFIPAGDRTMSRSDFITLAERGLDRLERLKQRKGANK